MYIYIHLYICIYTYIYIYIYIHIFIHTYIQPIEQVRVKEESKLDDTLWHREKYWQALLFTNSHGMNSMADLYSKKRKGYRKK